MPELKHIVMECPICNKLINCHSKALMADLKCEDCVNYIKDGEMCIKDMNVTQVETNDNDMCQCTMYDIMTHAYVTQIENQELQYKLWKLTMGDS
jgi:hypothetical protein